MKRKNTLWSLVLALVMVLGVFAPLSALANVGTKPTAETKPKQGTLTVTLHKMLVTKDALKPRKVTVNTAGNGEDENLVTKLIVAKVEKDGEKDVTNYYEGTTKLDPTNATDKKFIDAYANAAPVFPGYSGLNGKPYDGNEITDKAAYFGQDTEMADVYFAWQKKVGGQWKYIDANGEVAKKTVGNAEVEITSPADKDFEKVVLGSKTTNTGVMFYTDQLPKGEYRIVEVKELSTYKVDGKVIANQKAVPVEITLPLVNNKGVVENVHVYPKNVVDKPEIDKNFAKEHGLKEVIKEGEESNKTLKVGADYANYQEKKAKASGNVGQEIPYEVKTKINAGSSYERLTWNDIMTKGLTFKKDLKIEASNGVVFEASDYELVQDNNGFRLNMKQSGLDKIAAVTRPADKNAEQKDVEITLTYHATINGSAVVDNPEKNNVTLEYSHKPGKDLEKKPVTPDNGNLTVNKTFAPENENTDGLQIVYTLWQNDQAVASITLDNKMVNPTGTKPEEMKSYQLTDKIKFTPGEKAFNGKFEGLEGTGWKISERVAGYNPVYAEKNANGQVTITNNKDNDNPPPLKPTTPEVVVGGKKFVKVDDKNTRLEGAEFVVKNEKGDQYLAKKDATKIAEQKNKVKTTKETLDQAVKAYNERPNNDNEKTLKKAVDEAQKAYNAAYAEYSNPYEWVDKINERVVKLTSNKDGQFKFEGFEYGSYNLEETKAPKDFAKLTSLVPFTVKEGSFTNVEVDFKYDAKESKTNDAQKVLNKLVTIPQTGGMGTVLFMVVGVALMGGAFIAMKKRSAEQA